MRALTRLMAILELAASEIDGITIASIAAHTDMPISTVSRLVHTLTDNQLLELNANGRYVVGNRIISLARRGMDQNELAIRARSHMTVLRDLTEETVSLHVPYHHQRVCIAEVRSEHMICRTLPPGEVKPILGTATGDALLAGHSVEELVRVFDEASIEPAEQEEALRHLESVKKDGWSYVDTWVDGVAALGVPIVEFNRVVAALTVSGPSNRYDRNRAMQHITQVIAAARAISRGEEIEVFGKG